MQELIAGLPVSGRNVVATRVALVDHGDNVLAHATSLRGLRRVRRAWHRIPNRVQVLAIGRDLRPEEYYAPEQYVGDAYGFEGQ